MFWNRINLRVLILFSMLTASFPNGLHAGIATISNSTGTAGTYNGNDIQRLKFRISGSAASASFDTVKLTSSGGNWTGSLSFGVSLATNGSTNDFVTTKTFTGTTVSTSGTTFDLQSFGRNFATNTDYWLLITPTTSTGTLLTHDGAFARTGDANVFANISSSPGTGLMGYWDYAGPDAGPILPANLDISFTASVPETGTLILFGSAALAGGIAAWNKKRRKNFLGSEPVLETTI